MRKKTEQKLRQEIAHRAARLVAIEGTRDYLTAKRKAASQLGICEKKYLPGNIEIEKALVDYQQLFHGDSQHGNLLQLRCKAAESMRAFRQFNPRLVGSVLSGSATEYSEITLHLFSDNPEEIILYLINNGMPYETCDRRIRTARDVASFFPACRFIAGQTPIVLIIFPLVQQNHPPLDPVDGNPMRRANESEITSLIKAMQTRLV
jgi:hypothetical protein